MIDTERLSLLIESYVLEDLRPNYDFNELANNAYEKDGQIIVKGPDFGFKFDAMTYEQISGAGGVTDDE